ncbi:EAL domain-containing protein [Acidovorax sp. sif1233]|uniref:EAL domain-containing protein n=1 Tax=unclassified Acidovorax TaxID=2684926 RepID=UPI001C4794E6|nr:MULTISPECIES: EAL domain-containing protein [unclassified Acidovorax]MBV7431494.1 EAL domain-containing protein [Acidovorax sp. sif0732]MBV7452711.1 EAL domain-containing protein [Acidovorax sp. sif0715]MBV7457978.1 EAL domain-containing protein [Acidovorax sp. sif1233]
MSLTKQLWLAIGLVMALAFGGSMLVSVLSARHYLQQQLQIKNFDNATSLALALSQLDKDPVTVELQVAAQFDAGHYRFIRIASPTGQTLVQRTFDGQLEGAPGWFARLIPISAEPGRALIQDGWKQYGTLTLASHDQYAYRSLWSGTLELLAWFVLGSLVAGGAGTIAVRRITRPLRDVVAQAEAIAERRFIKITEPRTPELRSVARGMNDMVARLRSMFGEEAARLEGLRKKVNRDAVTGLSSREYFLSHLREALEGEQFLSSGSLVIVRLANLERLNAQLGHQRVDALLKHLGSVLYKSGEGKPGQRAGRLNGGEFGVLCPSTPSPSEAAQDIFARLSSQWLPHWSATAPDLFHICAVGYRRQETLGALFSRADEALARAQSLGPNSMFADEGEHPAEARPAEQWRTLLTEAVTGGRLQLAFYPVVDGRGEGAIHQEGVIRLASDASGALLSAGDFMPMAAHLNLTAPIDLRVVRLAIEHLRGTAGDIAINLSSETIADFHFRNELMQLLRAYPDICPRLLFEVPEYGVFRAFDAFKELAHTLQQLGCRVGIEYFGQRFTEGNKLADLGLDYIKVHPSYVRGIAGNLGNQEFLKGLCSIAHAIGIQVIALGVESRDDLPLLASLGFDGATGPGIR